MKIMYFKVAEFILKVKLYDDRGRDKAEKIILASLQDFLIEGNKKVDFVIEIKGVIEKNKTAKVGKYADYDLRGKHQISLFQPLDTKHFQLAIQNVLYRLLSEGNGFFLHASASKVHGKANLFLGESGQGKSTAVKLLSGKFDRLSDDLSIIRKVNGKFYFFQQPLFEKNQIGAKNINRFELGSFFVLKKTDKFSVFQIKNREKIIFYLINQIRALDNKNAKTLMEMASKNYSNFYYLNFTKDEKKMQRFFNKLPI